MASNLTQVVFTRVQAPVLARSITQLLLLDLELMHRKESTGSLETLGDLTGVSKVTSDWQDLVTALTEVKESAAFCTSSITPRLKQPESILDIS